MPEISLDMVQTVALGPFNPHIIEPDWLIEQEICTRESYQGFDIVTDDEGDEEVYRFGDMEWQVNYERLAVSSRKPGDDTGKPVAKVMQELRHTPVRAVGNNFHFSCSLSDWDETRFPQLGLDRSPQIDGATPSQTRWRASYERGDCLLELQLAVARKEQLVIVLFNHERKTETATISSAVQAANRFCEDWEATKKVLHELFTARVKT